MKTIDASELSVGKAAVTDYFSTEGELLISKGVTITDNHISALRRRNIFELRVRDPEFDNELQKLLKAEFESLDDLELDDKSARRSVPAPQLHIPDIGLIKPGRDGLDQLIGSPTVVEFDRWLRRGHTLDRPVGRPMKETMGSLSTGERTTEYKRRIVETYQLGLREIRTIVSSLVQSSVIDTGNVRALIDRFSKVLAMDRDIVLNLSNSKQPDNDDYLFNHLLNTSLIALGIGASYGYNEKQVAEIGLAGLLHDVGMLLIPESVRLKKGRLTRDEWYEVQKHPILGLHLLEKARNIPEAVTIVAYQSHERENGTGYPRQRTGRFIHRYSKIIACADIIEAYSSPRSYRPAQPPYQAMEAIVKMAARNLLDSDVVRAALMFLSLFPVGSIVELSDRRLARVVRANGTAYSQPVVSVLTDMKGNRLAEKEISEIDLKTQLDMQIIRSHRFDTGRNFDMMHGF